MGCRTAVFTLNLDNVALMPCNPSVGGPGKGHLVREIDALGGEMARNTDATSIQIRQLNTSKGPAVQALRAQSDKRAYSQCMKLALERQPYLDVKQAVVDDLILTREHGAPAVAGVVTSTGTRYLGRTVVLTTGTFLKGRIIVGEQSYPAGRAGEFPADNLSSSLARCGFFLGRLKTGTPPRVDGKTIDFSRTQFQSGSDEPLFFSWDARRAFRAGQAHSPNARSPIADLGGEPWPTAGSWREQLACFQVETSERTHTVIRQNLHRAPMYNGGITSVGPRYCPSIETKIVRFAEKSSHSLFLEPEGWHTREMYVQGANTSLPEDVQLEMLRTIPALRRCEIMRAGYAIEYDYLPGTQVHASLETKLVRNLFLAGQIIGTTGYEEAGSLGIMAGINAACRATERAPVVLRRNQAYIGVLIDDLVTKTMDEPYRMHTSQAEFRLLLRQDNAEERLSGIGHELGLIADERYREVCRRKEEVDRLVSELSSVMLHPSERTNERLSAAGAEPLRQSMRAADFLSRPGARLRVLQELEVVPLDVVDEVGREVETRLRYATYVRRQESEVERLRRLEERAIPADLDYARVQGLRSESRERLEQVRPRTIGQASRVAGVTSSDVSMLLVALERAQRQVAAR
jgi:tRNA uridine 5-carboxymethylaminomethyl modification enzyme